MGQYLGLGLLSAAATVSCGTSETELYTGRFLGAKMIGVYVTDAGSNAYVLYPQYSSDGTTWFQDVDLKPSLAAAEEGFLRFEGGFYIRAAGIKATGAENVSVHTRYIYSADEFMNVPILSTTTVSVGTSATNMHTGALSEEECDTVVALINDNGKSNQLDIRIWLSDDQGTTFYFYRTVRIDTALSRRGAVVIHNDGQRVKITGIKAVSAENVDITIIGRRPIRPRR